MTIDESPVKNVQGFFGGLIKPLGVMRVSRCNRSVEKCTKTRLYRYWPETYLNILNLFFGPFIYFFDPEIHKPHPRCKHSLPINFSIPNSMFLLVFFVPSSKLICIRSKIAPRNITMTLKHIDFTCCITHGYAIMENARLFD